ncbi:MAG: MotA/TolQ/ExbB proton channel family protein [Myxococcota bacterium]
MHDLELLVDQLRDTVARGGFVMPPLVLAAAALWYALGWRAWTLRRGTLLRVRTLVDRVRAGRRIRPRGMIDTAVLRGLTLAERGVPDLRAFLDEAFTDLEDDLGRYGTLVKAIVVVAPLTGLLGTVAGMVETFDALGEMALFTQSGGIAGGISQALLSTQMGLAVAIPGLVVGRMLQRKQELLGGELEQVKDTLCSGEVLG